MLIIGTEHCSVKMKQPERLVLVRNVSPGYLACHTAPDTMTLKGTGNVPLVDPLNGWLTRRGCPTLPGKQRDD